MVNESGPTTKVSVVVPVYNVIKYLKRCLLSISGQLFDGFEVILVDDCSKDDSGLIAQEFTIIDRRFKYVRHEKNQGLGPARNTGIKLAKGKYITFIDSDDWIEPGYLSNLFSTAEKFNADVVQTSVRWVWEDGGKEELSPLFTEKETIIEGESILKTFSFWDGQPSLLDSAWAKIFRKVLFDENNLEFPPILGEDTPAMFQFAYFAQRLVVAAGPAYCYYQRANSIQSEGISRKYLNDRRIGVVIIHDFLEYRCMLNRHNDVYLRMVTGFIDKIYRVVAGSQNASLRRSMVDEYLDIYFDEPKIHGYASQIFVQHFIAAVRPYPELLWRLLEKLKQAPSKEMMSILMLNLNEWELSLKGDG